MSSNDQEYEGCFTVALILSFIALALAFLYIVSIFIGATFIYLLANTFIFLFNFIKFLWYQFEILFTYLDRILFKLPFHPVVSWSLLGLIISLPISFILATKFVRKPILIQKIALISFPLLTIAFLYTTTKGDINPEKVLLEKINRAESLSESLRYYNALIKINPDNENYFIKRAEIHEKLGSLSSAITDISRAIALNPKNPDYYFARAQLYEKTNEFKNALSDYKTLNSLVPKEDSRKGLINYKISYLEEKIREIEKPIVTPKPKPPSEPKRETIGIIIGSMVNLRDNYTFNSKVIQKLDNNEEVIILDKKISSSTSEAITKYEIKVETSAGLITLNKGKLLNIIAESPDQFIVSFNYGNSELTAKIPSSSIEKISGHYWYLVKTKKGKIGWVYEKFIAVK